jgi:adenine-specific DNA-methyltransferase
MTDILKADMKSMDIVEHQINKLKQLYPEVFIEGNQIDWERLRLTLGDAVDTGKERYGMVWPGKSDCYKAIQQSSIATLKPAREESVDFDTTQNLFIEGDNLEVLKLLQKSYLGKVKMIYIDPPYNTGKDFIYPDNYSENLGTYLRYTGQVDDEGRKFSTNSETDGRFHSKWMNMMYPRLFLAKNLLRDDGVIFISIDDHEVHNLRLLMNEIFGEENFIANVVWEKKYTRSNDAKWFSDNHDHILVAARNKEGCRFNLLPRTEDQIAAYGNPDNHSKGRWKATPLHAKSGTDGAFSYTFRNGVIWSPPPGTFPRFSKESMDKLDRTKEIWFGTDGKGIPSKKSFLAEVKAGVTSTTLWSYQEVGHNHEATEEIKKLLPENPFNNPKPTRLIQRMLNISTSKNDIILDFFAGSATTAHAVLKLNAEDDGNRRFICVQLPEPTNRDDYHTIAEIGKERIRRVIKKIKHGQDRNGDMPDNSTSLDLGFKVFKLAPSNFKVWDASMDKTPKAIQTEIEAFVEHIDPLATEEDVLYELLLKAGYPLITSIEKLSMEGKTVYSIDGESLSICLEKELTLPLLRAMAANKPARVICLDVAFGGNDALKTNAVQIMKSQDVEFRTV